MSKQGETFGAPDWRSGRASVDRLRVENWLKIAKALRWSPLLRAPVPVRIVLALASGIVCGIWLDAKHFVGSGDFVVDSCQRSLCGNSDFALNRQECPIEVDSENDRGKSARHQAAQLPPVRRWRLPERRSPIAPVVAAFPRGLPLKISGGSAAVSGLVEVVIQFGGSRWDSNASAGVLHPWRVASETRPHFFADRKTGS